MEFKKIKIPQKKSVKIFSEVYENTWEFLNSSRFTKFSEYGHVVALAVLVAVFDKIITMTNKEVATDIITDALQRALDQEREEC
tara:strand:- start:45 stop:296 length:252 start_codon:yes stop_codon:yes gene_type:complete